MLCLALGPRREIGRANGQRHKAGSQKFVDGTCPLCEPWKEFINFRRREFHTGRSLGTQPKFQRAFHCSAQEFGLSPASRVRGSCSILKTTPILSTENCSAGD
jgi:hypothetical protein